MLPPSLAIESLRILRRSVSSAKKTTAFFLVPTLRSICEDLIVLAYIARIPEEDRNRLSVLLMSHELSMKLKSQREFFRVARSEQPVLNADLDLTTIRGEMRSIWRRNGWPNLNGGMPPVRQMAEKYHINLLSTLYEYLYRLTSGMVHFNAQSLLRSGWGKTPTFTFSPLNFDAYYVAYARIYGMLLFCLYFELFLSEQRPDRKVVEIVELLNEDLLMEHRWPETVTFEEINQPLSEGS